MEPCLNPFKPIFVNAPMSSSPPGVNALAALDPGLTPDQAKVAEPMLMEKVRLRQRAVEVATSATGKCKQICDENGVHQRFLSEQLTAARREWAELKRRLRPEHLALKEAFAAKDHAASLRALADVAEYWRVEHDDHTSAKMGLENLLFLDAIAEQRREESNLSDDLSFFF